MMLMLNLSAGSSPAASLIAQVATGRPFFIALNPVTRTKYDRILVLRLWENHQIRKSHASKLYPQALSHSDAQKD